MFVPVGRLMTGRVQVVIEGDGAGRKRCATCWSPDPDRVAPHADATGAAQLAWFLVRWEIDLEAAGAKQAARAALAIQRDPTSIATFFTVRPVDDPDAEVELDLLEWAEPRPGCTRTLESTLNTGIR